MLADAVNPRGASWGPDGVILFVPAPDLGIYQAPAAGGAVTPVIPGAQTSYPSFLPDGRHFLYSSVQEGDRWITLGSLDGKTARPLLKAWSRAQYANGHLLFGSKGALYAQPFDVGSLTLSGERVRIVDTLGFGSGSFINYAFSASDDVIVVGNAPYLPPSQLTWLDARGTPLGGLGEVGHISGFSVSPDRTRVVVERLDPANNSIDPWIVTLDTGFATALRASVEGSQANSPVWSHDGNRIFSFAAGLRIESLSGGKADHWPMRPHWPLGSSPDGRFLLISVQSAATGSDLMLVPLTGEHTPVPYLQTDFEEQLGRLSPDGRSVAYISNESGRYEVYVQSFPQPGNKTRISTTGGSHPEWSEDGRSVYFLSPEANGTWAMMVAQIGGTAPHRLFTVPPGHRDGARSAFAVFDNGRRFLGNVFVPDPAPQAITIGLNWTASLDKGR